MPSIMHDGKRFVITKAAYQCLLCGDVFETKLSRGLVSCKCGAASLDGGISAGATVNGDPFQMVDLSVYKTEAQGGPQVRLPQEVVTRMYNDFLDKYPAGTKKAIIPVKTEPSHFS